MSKLTQSELNEKYHDLFNLIVENPRITPRDMAKKLKFSGQGKARSTIVYHLTNMYTKEYSLKPQLKILPFSNLKKYVYFCRKEDRKDVYETFLDLHSNKDISFVECLSGLDFFITSFKDNIDFEIDSLVIEEKSMFFRSIYIQPSGWDKKHRDCFTSLLKADYAKGRLPRKNYGSLDWSETDWRIYISMRNNVRRKFTSVGKYAGIDSKTAKKHYYEKIVPKCDIAHYFFPNGGRQSYREMLLKIKTDFENSFVNALKKLPCTSYVYPLDASLVIFIFQQDEKLILFILQKLKEIGIINDYLFYTPLIHGIKE